LIFVRGVLSRVLILRETEEIYDQGS